MNFCDCISDSYCQRYKRLMGGRLREICQGFNVDLGQAAEIREQWAREAETMNGIYDHNISEDMTPRQILLKTDQSPGDAVAMTAAIYSLHRAHPGRFITAVESPWPSIFENNPDVVPADSIPQAEPLQMHYPAIHKANERGIHFMQGYCEHIGAALGIVVPLLTNRPHLYFDKPAGVCSPYWIICSGGKDDFTNKLWGHYNYQKVVDNLEGKINFVQVGGKYDNHPLLNNVDSLVGKTSLRELFEYVYLSRGVICGVSLLMHVAAALEKPAIVIAGGREPVAWNTYPKQHYLHTVGVLPCCENGGCWRSRVVPLGDGTLFDNDTCKRPVNGTQTLLSKVAVPECMTLISPAQVSALVMRYNEYCGG